MNFFLSVCLREWRILYRQPRDMVLPLLFFTVIVSLFPLAITPDPGTLRHLAPGIFWVAALFSLMLSFERLFHADYEEGTLVQWILSPAPLPVLVAAKVLMQWCATGLPLIVLAPLLAYTFQLPPHAIAMLALSLAVGTPALSLLGAVIAALTLGLRNSGLLLTILLLPLTVPILIFGASAVEFANAGLAQQGQLAWMTVILLLSLCFAPFAIAAALRISVGE